MESCICVDDFGDLAAKKLAKDVLDFCNSGATDEQTLEENPVAFKSWRFQPRVLRDVSHVDISSSVLGRKINFPVCISPFGLHKMAAPGGEIDSAKAAEGLGIGFTMSTWSSYSIEDVATNVPGVLRWFQLYITKDRSVTEKLVFRAEKNGYTAIVVTVDGVAHGRRYRNIRNKFSWPSDKPPKNLEGISSAETAEIGKVIDSNMDQSITWKDIEWLKTITDLPIIIKGVLTVETALEAIEHNISAIVVSNHGGRRLDSTLPAIHALPRIAKAVKGRCEIYFDSGIRNGGDVAKALALGARAVLVGRPIIWGLACGGEKGARKVLEILRDELELTMKLLGVTSIAELQSTPDVVVHESNIIAKL